MLYPTSLPTRVELQMNVVRGLTMQKQMGDKIFLFCHFFKKNYALSDILSLYYLNLFHTVQCIGDLYLQTLCSWTLPRKNAWLLGKKSLCLCAYGLVFQPILWFSFCFHLLPHNFYHLSNEAMPVLSCFFFLFCFILLRSVDWSSES